MRESEPGRVDGRGTLVRVPPEMYSAERKAEFLLSNAVDEADYEQAVREVRRMEVDPDSIQHQRP